MTRQLPDWLQKPESHYQNANTRRGYRYWKAKLYATPPWLTKEHRQQIADITRPSRHSER